MTSVSAAPVGVPVGAAGGARVTEQVKSMSMPLRPLGATVQHLVMQVLVSISPLVSMRIFAQSSRACSLARVRLSSRLLSVAVPACRVTLLLVSLATSAPKTRANSLA